MWDILREVKALLPSRDFIKGAPLGAAGVPIKGRCLVLNGSKYPIPEIPEDPVNVELLDGYLRNSVRFVPEDPPRETIGKKGDVEDMSPEESLRFGEYAAGLMVLDALDEKTAKQLGLYLVEGVMPDADFWGVKFDGSVSDLNHALRKTGLSIIVSESVE